MKMCFSSFRPAIAAFVAVMTISAARAGVTAQLEPGQITLGQSAQLTITASGDGSDTVAPPDVPGLQFVPAGQSSQIEIVNGATTSTTSQTYEVVPQRTGKFTIPSLGSGGQQLVLYVQPGGGGNVPPAPGNNPAASGDARLDDSTAFSRLVLPQHELYVGQSVPVDIQVAFRPGLVGSLNGLPTLNGDAFTLNKLSAQPEQTDAIVNGKPYTILTWHSVLAAVKPGNFSLTVDTPVTVRMRTPARRMPRIPNGFFDDSMLDDAFNDSFFQSFFGTTTEKEITLTSRPNTVEVQPLPLAGQPAGFSGAIGQFDVASDLSAGKADAGEPLTLRLKVSGKGNFDRVNSTMLAAANGWKTYQPTAKFTPEDSAGYSGEKVFEQAVVPMEPGKRALPALAFSFFNPETQQYETKTAAPLSVDISPAPGGALAATPPAPQPAQSQVPEDGLRPDEVETGGTVSSLYPLYYQPWFLAMQGALVFCFAAGLVFFRRREYLGTDPEGGRQREESSAVARCLAEMEAATAAKDPARFFQSARVALQQKLANRWHVAPASITIAEIDARLNGEGQQIRRVFAIADQAAYSGQHLSMGDFKAWKEIVRHELQHI